MLDNKDGDMFELAEDLQQAALIKVVGVGGGGGNAVKYMIDNDIQGVDFICANTDVQALRNISARTIIQLGHDLTKGLGAGANPEVGRQAALADRERIAESLKGADLIFITAGMGGGTGTGAAPVIAEVAKELGILTVAVVTKPFAFEGGRRSKAADLGLKYLSESVDSLITIPNEKLLPVLGDDISLVDAFAEVNKVLQGAVQGIADLIIRPGLINVDFADVRTVMSEMGQAMMGSGVGIGSNRAIEAAEMAIRSPLLEDIDLHGARGVLINITAGVSIGLKEYNAVGEHVSKYADSDAVIVTGTVIDPDMSTDELRVTVVATGLNAENKAEQKPTKVVDNTEKSETDEGADYQGHSRGESMRSQQGNAAYKTDRATAPNTDYLDIPAYLRRQADQGMRPAHSLIIVIMQ